MSYLGKINLLCGILWPFGKGKHEYLIPGIEEDVLGNILSYIYTGNIYMTDENICDLVIASGYLLLDELFLEFEAVFKKSFNCEKLSSNFHCFAKNTKL